MMNKKKRTISLEKDEVVIYLPNGGYHIAQLPPQTIQEIIYNKPRFTWKPEKK